MRRIRKIVNGIIVLVLCISMFQWNYINAGGISVSVSPSSVEVGQQFTISVSASGVFVEGLTVNCSGCTLLSNINPTIDTGETKTATARLDSASGASVTVSGTAASYDVDANEEFAVSGTAYVSAKAKPSTTTPNTNNNGSSSSVQNSTPNVNTNQNINSNNEEEQKEDKRSKNNDLGSLSINQGELSPKFSSDTTSYKVDLPADIEKITLNAKAKDDKASVSGDGEKTLKAGKNEFTITVTAENGSTKKYKIEIYVDEKPLVYTMFNDTKLGVVRNIEGLDVPKGFTETKVKIEDKEVVAWTNEKINKTIVYLSDEENNKSFYLYEDGNIISSFMYRKMLGKELYVVDVPTDKQSIKGMKYQKVTIDETELNGWVFEDKNFENYIVIYVMNINGNMEYYQYEKTQNTLQLYSGAAAISQQNYEEQIKKLDDYKFLNTIMICGVIGLLVLIVGMTSYIIYSKKKKKRFGTRLVRPMNEDEE